jgi:hypothetical protein
MLSENEEDDETPEDLNNSISKKSPEIQKSPYRIMSKSPDLIEVTPHFRLK